MAANVVIRNTVNISKQYFISRATPVRVGEVCTDCKEVEVHNLRLE